MNQLIYLFNDGSLGVIVSPAFRRVSLNLLEGLGACLHCVYILLAAIKLLGNVCALFKPMLQGYLINWANRAVDLVNDRVGAMAEGVKVYASLSWVCCNEFGFSILFCFKSGVLPNCPVAIYEISAVNGALHILIGASHNSQRELMFCGDWAVKMNRKSRHVNLSIVSRSCG